MPHTKRMLHNTISTSLQVNNLPLPGQLLFTWLIAHADDDGKLKGDPKYIKANVVPYTNWSPNKIRAYLELMKNEGLIYYWKQNNEWFIEFPKWKQFQTIQNDRYHKSRLPSYLNESVSGVDTERIQNTSIVDPQVKLNESNKIEVNKSEDNEMQAIADKKATSENEITHATLEEKSNSDSNSFKRIGEIISPKNFVPSNENETAALDTWNRLEPYNSFAFQTTYLKACLKGLPAHRFYQFASEIQQDPNIKNKGAVFNKKVEEYLGEKI